MAVSHSKSTELELIRRAAGGDRLASGELIRAHQTGLYGYILRMCGRTDLAEDVVQEAFVRVLTNLDRFDPRFRFSTWLFTIGRRVLFNMMEKRRPASDSDHVADVCEAPEPVTTPHDRYIIMESVQRALMTLGEDQREVVVLFHQHDWPIWLIAKHLEIPEGTVKSHLHRGRAKLRLALAHEAEISGVPVSVIATAGGSAWAAKLDDPPASSPGSLPGSSHLAASSPVSNPVSESEFKPEPEVVVRKAVRETRAGTPSTFATIRSHKEAPRE